MIFRKIAVVAVTIFLDIVRTFARIDEGVGLYMSFLNLPIVLKSIREPDIASFFAG